MISKIRKMLNEDNLEYEFLSPALEIEETPPRPFRRLLIWIILVIAVTTFLWSYFGKVDEVAVARGKIIPDGRVKVVQPIEAGVVREIHVKEGQRVKEGQILIELDPTIKGADVESSARGLSIHRSDKERLLAELKSEEMDPRTKGDLFELQRKLKGARESEYKAREDALKLIVVQKESALQAAESIMTKLEKTSAISGEQELAYRTLFTKGYASRMDMLEKQKEYYTVTHDLEAQRKLVRQAKDSLEEVRKNLEALRKEREKGLLSDIVDRERSITAFSGEAIKARKKYELDKLRSPVDGTVHGLAAYTIGGVVTPAQQTVTIVPFGTPLIVEAMALNQDIGFLKEGQEAEIKFDTFPFQKYGTVRGKVVWLSPDAVEDEKLGPVYKMKIEMERLKIMVDGKVIAISPGMAVSAEVKTNKRRIIEFFLSPIIKYATESLTLR